MAKFAQIKYSQDFLNRKHHTKIFMTEDPFHVQKQQKEC